jgi:hypothetical protein
MDYRQVETKKEKTMAFMVYCVNFSKFELIYEHNISVKEFLVYKKTKETGEHKCLISNGLPQYWKPKSQETFSITMNVDMNKHSYKLFSNMRHSNKDSFGIYHSVSLYNELVGYE